MEVLLKRKQSSVEREPLDLESGLRPKNGFKKLDYQAEIVF